MDLDAVATAIQALNVDLLAVQEVDRTLAGSVRGVQSHSGAYELPVRMEARPGHRHLVGRLLVGLSDAGVSGDRGGGCVHGHVLFPAADVSGVGRVAYEPWSAAITAGAQVRAIMSLAPNGPSPRCPP